MTNLCTDFIAFFKISVSESLPLARVINLLLHGIWVRSSALWHVVVLVFFFSRAESYSRGQSGCWEELVLSLTKEMEREEEGHGAEGVGTTWGDAAGDSLLRRRIKGTGYLQVWLPLPLSYPWLYETGNHLDLKQELKEDPSRGLLSLLCGQTAASDRVREQNSTETSLSTAFFPAPGVLDLSFPSACSVPLSSLPSWTNSPNFLSSSMIYLGFVKNILIDLTGR